VQRGKVEDQSITDRVVPEAGVEPARTLWVRGILSSDQTQRPYNAIRADFKQIEKIERVSLARLPCQLLYPIFASGKARAKLLSSCGPVHSALHGSQEVR